MHHKISNPPINSHLKLPPSKKRYSSSIMDFMMEEKGDDFYGKEQIEEMLFEKEFIGTRILKEIQS